MDHFNHLIKYRRYNMPRLDKTGPKGLGPKTGRGMGDCSNQSTSEYSESMPGRSMSCQGRGLGLRRGNGRGPQGGGLRNRCRRWQNRFTGQQENQ